MRPLVFLDLDDTLFSTLRKNPTASIPVAFNRQGEWLSYMSSGQRLFLDWLARDAQVVPTTGRNRAAFERVRLDFDGFAICSFGGLILTPDGQPETRWHTRMERAALEHETPLERVVQRVLSVAAATGADVRARVIFDAGLPLYASIKHNQDDGASLATLALESEHFVPAGWRMHLNDNNMSVMPPFLGKEFAVAWFMEEIASHRSFALGVGDSLSDAPFMALCDYVIAPSRSQLFSLIASQAVQ